MLLTIPQMLASSRREMLKLAISIMDFEAMHVIAHELVYGSASIKLKLT